ncbi:AI-2E family transporter [Candidatus Thioglobus sp.]|jgi:predicted PurR-regulated permease PerM|uniref:AI-2E family transporter n=1 Tax=Candidatus Thioglobus sp. TaxID=2026721 RepID=UPI001DF2E744|nr:AI-2E family transporter [Candidatus Thioglobus sp.]MBT3276731.1 AI-2E family transporter [Candidatus Thioglobus sp.]MBT3446777.1 AI-2E family transporter [Candidatus Thioglobus sp.]MBT3744298.1 AI-2E family transporter [Candidatus Thioglobus sp.]MBT4000712.1 AI-2E family transporter [Candidatus Thioglobus sp.]MBT4182337.1 AI-2E family transporter [Candidatus Thioglobus sp.]
MNRPAPYEHGFMLSLLLLAIGGLIWLFTPFLPALFLALLIAIATSSQYSKLKQRWSAASSALLMTFLVTTILILPLSYILLISGLEVSTLIQTINTGFSLEKSRQILEQTLSGLPFSESIKLTLSTTINNNLEGILLNVKDFSIAVLGSILSLSSDFVFFLIVSVFALYYFYIDGKSIIKRLKNLSPLENYLDDILLKQFSSLSITLVGSVFSIAILQGVVFSIAVMIVGLPVLYFGIAMALASFIPVLGGLIIWLPLSIYLYTQGQTTDALIIVLFGALFIGTIIDNFIRPLIIQKFTKTAHQSSALDHTLITVLSTLAGIIQFGILGLFIGPIIAAMAISIFDVYAIKYADSLDQR